MIETFSDIVTEIGLHTFSTTSTDTTNYKRWANQGYMRVVYDVDYPFLRRSGTFVTVAQQRLYIPEVQALRFLNMRLPSQNVYLTKRDAERMDRSRPSYITDSATSSFGMPSRWYVEDWPSVQAQPVAAAAVKCTWGSAQGSTSISATVEGIVGGEEDREVVVITGNAGNVSTTKSFSEVHSISTDKVSVGNLVFTSSDSATTALCTIGPLMRSRKYIRIGLDSQPDKAYTVYYKFIPWLPLMVNDSDVPRIPRENFNVIVEAAMLVAAENHGDPDLLASREKRYFDAIGKIKETMREDEETVQQWGFGGGAAGYPVIAGDYNSYLRNVLWG